MRWCCVLVVAMLVAGTRTAPAEDTPTEPVVSSVATPRESDAEAPEPTAEPRPHVSRARRALAITAAIVPGVALRGLGSWLVGEKRAARRLALAAAAGFVVAGGAGGLVGVANGSPHTVPVIPIVIAGAGALLTSWAEDIWIAAGGSAVDARPLALPRYSLELGEVWQHDAYRQRLLQRGAGAVNVGRFGAGVAGMIDTGGDAWLVFADLRARIYGDDAACTDCFTVRTGGRLQRDRDDLVTQLVGEIELIGRLGIGRFDPAFRSTFVELSTGVGLNRVTYASMVNEVTGLLLGRFVWGAYIPGGEVSVFYDHRRDGLAGGIDASRASGFMGSFGASADVRIDGPWALRGEFQIGNAYLSTLALAYRGGPR